ncbi:HK97 gp10 family phage protein [Streptomyces sp. NPDC000927]|uniref:HK97 gp10 family phage protein n=1 Tax=Streptomyces sp. NPDC000927 TaxID=3154371 RepID=UPI00332BBF19
MRLVQFDERALQRLVEEHVKEIAEDVLSEARRTCPRRDGALARSLKAEVESERGRVTGRVYSDLEYAAIVHEGRGPVEAKPGKVLGPLPGPYPRFVRRVGPAKGQPWLLEALKRAQPYPVR